jgi:anti-anti-sigma factor
MTAASDHLHGAPFAVGLAVDTNDAILIIPRGELDMSVADELQQQFDRFARDGRSIVLDLGQLDFIDSSGLKVIIKTSRDCAANGCAFRVRPGNRQIMRTFEVAGLMGHLPLDA